MGTRSNWWRIPASLALLLLAGCTDRAAPPAGGPVPDPGWQAVTLPASGAGRPDVRDLAACPGHWYASGGYLMPDGATRPALWASTDGRAWTEIPVRPSSVYGPVQLLSAVTCRGGAVVAVGSTAGGVHANARTSTWVSARGDRLDEVPAPFELFGGPDAIGTGPMAAGVPGWLIAGNWRDANGQAGAAVWFSVDGAGFRLVDDDPALESDARGQTTALDALADPAGGFLVVGSVQTPGSRTAARDPAVWTSADGLAWSRPRVPATADDESLERAVPYRDGVLAVGERGTGFGAWLGTGGVWRAAGRFGAFSGTGLPVVTGLAVGPAQDVYALAGDGTRYRLWVSHDATSWTELALPARVPTGDQHLARLADGEGRLLLSTEDGAASRLWIAGGRSG